MNTKPNKGSFKKGHVSFNKGKKLSPEQRKKLSLSKLGNTNGFKKGIPGSIHRGREHYNWKGGISSNPYPTEFNKELKIKIRMRDNFTCCLCLRTEREELEELNRVLCVNHIDFNKNNCSEENLNTLCLKCNISINRQREFWTYYFNQ